PSSAPSPRRSSIGSTTRSYGCGCPTTAGSCSSSPTCGMSARSPCAAPTATAPRRSRASGATSNGGGLTRGGGGSHVQVHPPAALPGGAGPRPVVADRLLADAGDARRCPDGTDG